MEHTTPRILTLVPSTTRGWDCSAKKDHQIDAGRRPMSPPGTRTDSLLQLVFLFERRNRRTESLEHQL